MLVEELARLIGAGEDRVRLIKEAGLTDFKVKGKVSGVIVKKYAVVPVGKRVTLIVEEDLIERLPEKTLNLIKKASRLPGEVTIDTTRGSAIARSGGTVVLLKDGRVEAVADLKEAGKLSAVLGNHIDGKVLEILKAVSRGSHVLKSVAGGMKVHVDDESVELIVPGVISIRIEPGDVEPGWKELVAGVIATLVNEKVVGKDAFEKIGDPEIVKLTKSFLEKRLFPF